LCRNYKGNHHGLVITGQPYFKVLPDNSDTNMAIYTAGIIDHTKINHSPTKRCSKSGDGTLSAPTGREGSKTKVKPLLVNRLSAEPLLEVVYPLAADDGGAGSDHTAWFEQVIHAVQSRISPDQNTKLSPG
jgi:hypothetical protein